MAVALCEFIATEKVNSGKEWDSAGTLSSLSVEKKRKQRKAEVQRLRTGTAEWSGRDDFSFI